MLMPDRMKAGSMFSREWMEKFKKEGNYSHVDVDLVHPQASSSFTNPSSP